jgi:glycerophosphoryl diester phosphodiesterase
VSLLEAVRPLICAHRGARATLPDNSLAAFEEAIAIGCEVIETDVRLDADGRLVLSHDFRDDGYPDAVQLGVLLELAGSRIGLDLEIKEVGIERKVVGAVRRREGVIVTSFADESVSAVRALDASIPTGLLLESLDDGDPFELAERCEAGTIVVHERLATGELLAAARTSGCALWVWAADERQRLTELIAEPAVAAVITDAPVLALELRGCSVV